jgi:hypothetical protein
MTTPDAAPTERNLGLQPLDAILAAHHLGNHDVVAACDEPLTHKAVQRARKGRRLTAHMQRRITSAVNKAAASHGSSPERTWQVTDLFTY